MYEETKDWSLWDILIKFLFVLLFILLLMWALPGPIANKVVDEVEEKLNIDVLTSQIFSDNLDAMEKAGMFYFDNAKMPKEIGGKVSITLKEMIDQKLIENITDKDGKSCSISKSYIEVVKLADFEYEMKVMLSCDEKQDYRIVPMGCNDVCELDKEEVAVVEEEKKTTTKKTTKPKTTPVSNDTEDEDTEDEDTEDEDTEDEDTEDEDTEDEDTEDEDTEDENTGDIDTTPNVAPTLNLTQNYSGLTSGNITIIATASDTDGTISSITTPSGTDVASATTTYTVSYNGTYTFTAKDNDGDTVSTSISVTNIDKSKPYFTYNKYIDSDNKYNIEITPRDSGSGISNWSYSYSNDGGVTYSKIYSEAGAPTRTFTFDPKVGLKYIVRSSAYDRVGNATSFSKTSIYEYIPGLPLTKNVTDTQENICKVDEANNTYDCSLNDTNSNPTMVYSDGDYYGTLDKTKVVLKTVSEPDKDGIITKTYVGTYEGTVELTDKTKANGYWKVY